MKTKILPPYKFMFPLPNSKTWLQALWRV